MKRQPSKREKIIANKATGKEFQKYTSLLVMVIYFLWIHDLVLISTIYRKVFWIRHSLFTYIHTHTHTPIYQKGKALHFSVPFNSPKCSSYLLIIRRKVNLPRVTEHKDRRTWIVNDTVELLSQYWKYFLWLHMKIHICMHIYQTMVQWFSSLHFL